MNSRVTTVALADKNIFVRQGLQTLLREDSRFKCVGVANSGRALLELLNALPCDLVICGWHFIDFSGEDLLQEIKNLKLDTRVVIYSGVKPSERQKLALEQGAWGLCLKSEAPEVLLDTLTMVSRGRISIPWADPDIYPDIRLQRLTDREAELLKILSEGWTNQQIAQKIGISQNTVKYHLKNLFEKLNVNNRSMAVSLFHSAKSNSS